jgi:hypothetical protein
MRNSGDAIRSVAELTHRLGSLGRKARQRERLAGGVGY